MGIITLDPIMVSDISTYKGLNTQMFSGLSTPIPSVKKTMLGVKAFTVACADILQVVHIGHILKYL